MRGKTKLYLLASGVVIYSIGYVALLGAALQGELGGITGLAAVLMATGVLVAMVFGILLFKVQAEVLGEL